MLAPLSRFAGRRALPRSAGGCLREPVLVRQAGPGRQRLVFPAVTFSVASRAGGSGTDRPSSANRTATPAWCDLSVSPLAPGSRPVSTSAPLSMRASAALAAADEPQQLGASGAKPPSARPLTIGRAVRMYNQLSKLKLSVFVTGTAALGFLTAGPPVSVPALIGVTLGTYLCSASAGTWNQLYEIKNDALMTRTRARPLPSGRMSKAHAATFGAVAGLSGVGLLAVACNPLTAALGAANIGIYSLIYTPMKQVSFLNTEVGAIVGAIPPLMGWAACTGSITAEPAGAALFAALFLWQMPHFYALAWRHRADYARGGYAMVSKDDPDGRRTATRTLGYSLGLLAFPVATTLAGVTSPMFVVEATAANTLFMHKAWRFYRDPSDDTARGVFFASLWYLPIIMFFLMFHSHRWRSATDAEDARELGEAVPAVEARVGEGQGEVPQWLEEVDMVLATAFADDPVSRWVSENLSGAAARARRVLRSHCPHEILTSAPRVGEGNETEGSLSVARASAAAGECPVSHNRGSSAAVDALGKVLPCPVSKSQQQVASVRSAAKGSAVATSESL